MIAYLGIDQTGAAIRGGRAARPLAAALVRKKGATWLLTTHRLPSVAPDQIASLDPSLSKDLSGLAILVDCVLGLPVAGMLPRSRDRLTLRDFVNEIRSETGFGREVAHGFFIRLLERHYADPSPAKPPVRRVEVVAGSNSVFTFKPFQRNVQTGTYRIWHDIIHGGPDGWCSFWPSETIAAGLPARPVLFEGYPTLFWETVFGQRTRRPAELPRLLKSAAPELQLEPACQEAIAKDPDLADAAVLAAGAYVLDSPARSRSRKRAGSPIGILAPPPEPVHPIEGWILGLDAGETKLSGTA